MDRIEHATIREVGGLRRSPGTEDLAYREELQLGQACHVGSARRLRMAWPVIMSCRDLLPLWRVQELKIGLRKVTGTALGGVALDHGDRRFSQDRHSRRDDLELLGAQFIERQPGF